MHFQRSLVLVTLIICGLLWGTTPPSTHASPPGRSAYIEPTLLAPGANMRSVIVSGARPGVAAAAVPQIGGRVTSDLQLIDGVAAIVPAAGLNMLARLPGITSIVDNKGVKSSDWNGWVTDIRILKASYAAGDTLTTPPVYLPDGGFVSYSTNGKLLVVNADGSERVQSSLPGGGPFTTLPVVGADGTSYVAGQALRVFAFTPAGAMRWQFTTSGSDKFLGGVVLSSDGATVYAADSGRSVYALDAATGAKRWQFRPATSVAGSITASPTVGPDGTLYYTTDKGWVVAVNPTGTQRWAYNSRVALTLSPTVAPDGVVYAVSTGAKRLIALNTTTGALVYSKTFSGTPHDRVVVGPDGSVYLATEPALFAFTPTGTQRFSFPASGGMFKTEPALSADGATLYIAVAGKNLFAVDAASGAQRWMYLMSGNMADSPATDMEGGVVAGSDTNEIVRLGPDGTLSARLVVSDKITQSASTSRRSSDAAVRVGTSTLVTVGRMPDHWDGRKDVIETTNKTIYQLVNPVSVDIGADALHRTRLPSGAAINGTGVTVAVVDSGIYFDKDVKAELGSTVQKLFRGQIDFAEPICATVADKDKLLVLGTQYDGYCAQTMDHSIDPYGHGTAVASVIWNNFIDYDTHTSFGIAPGANILSVRVLDDDGAGSYETVIKGIQYVVQNKALHNIRVLNLSLSGDATTPYFVDPLNRAAEAAWASGIVVLAAAGNGGPVAETVTVPGNDPYVITVGSVSSNRTPGYWADDYLPTWSATGPTPDGFVKPDILAPGANIVTFMYNGGLDNPATQKIVTQHPESSSTASLFRMNGTSISAGIASGVVALMLQARPELTPDEVKGRLLESARPALDSDGQLLYSPLQQGHGRIWAPDAVLGSFTADSRANQGMDIVSDLAHGYATEAELAYHYQGAIQRVLSDDGQAYLYYAPTDGGDLIGIGVSRADTRSWVDWATLASGRMTWSVGRMTWSVANNWDGGLSLASGRMTWSVGRMTWSVGRMTWSVGRMTWSVGRMTWSVSTTWSSGADTYAAAVDRWTSSSSQDQHTISSILWVDDD